MEGKVWGGKGARNEAWASEGVGVVMGGEQEEGSDGRGGHG